MAETAGAAPARWRSWAPFVAVTLLGFGLLWPVPFGAAPRSADHLVHLARVELWAELLAQGQLRGWSWAWFFGAPIGELYPPLGDMGVVALRALSLGSASWSSAYAWTFAAAFCLQGWAAIVVARRFGLDPWIGAAAGALAMLDPGFTREGGWMYTVEFGVWPQVLSTSLCWLGFALIGERPATVADKQPGPARPLLAALAFAAAFLAHPMALPVAVLGGLVWLVFVARREGFGEFVARGVIVALLAFALAAWWLLPMLEHRAWMASYGWLFAPSRQLLSWLGEGHWAQRMPPAVGYLALVGVVFAVVRGPRVLRASALLAVGLWLATASDLWWGLRLDRISEGFSHIQYQRFLIAAKPGLYLLAAWICLAPVLAMARRLRAEGRPALRSRTSAFALLALAATVWVGVDAARAAREHGVGRIQTHRGYADLRIPDADFDAAMQWLEARAAEEPEFWRVAVRAPRNVHWFMDAGARLSRPVYKGGFTPGDNFVHKPESMRPALLDRLRVRYVLTHRASPGPLPRERARFGDLRILERALPPRTRAHAGQGPLRATLIGQGSLRVENESPTELVLIGEGLGPQSEIVYDVAGHPGWRLELDGVEIPWDEVPAFGDGPAATPAAREAGELRGGRAEGDSGAEAILIRARPGREGRLRLHFEASTTRGALGLALSLLTALAMMAGALWSRRRGRPISLPPAWPWLHRLRPAHLLPLVGLAGLALGLRWMDRRAAEANTVLRWAQAGPGVEAGPLKTEMLIRPALGIELREGESTNIELEGLPCGRELTGWIAIDDDAAKVRSAARYRLEWPDASGKHEPVELRHRPGRVFFARQIPACAEGTQALTLRAELIGKGRQRLGLWLESETKEQP